MKISRELALKILKYLLENRDFNFPFVIMCRGYGTEDGEFVEIVPEDDYEKILTDKNYDDFEIWENLQNLDKNTLNLMLIGFIDKIEKENIVKEISALAFEYRNAWKEDLWETEDIKKFGHNEFIGGKAEAYEECLNIIKNRLLVKNLIDEQ